MTTPNEETRPRRGPSWLVPAAFVVFCGVVAALRFDRLIEAGAPVGIDPGNWLTIGHRLLGERIIPASIAYPPLVPLMLAGAVSWLGATNGVALVAVLASLAPGAGVYLVLRWAGLKLMAAVVGALLVPASATGEAVGWGGYPQLISLGLSAVFVYLVDRAMRSRRPRDAFVAGLVAALNLSSSHLVGLTAAFAGVIVVVLHLFFVKRGKTGLLKPATLAMLPSLPLIPIYLQLTRLDFAPNAGRLGVSDIPETVQFLYRDAPNLWWSVMALAALTPLLLLDRRREPLWIGTTALLVASLAVFLATGELRFVYLLPVAGALAVGCWVNELQRSTGFMRRIVWPAVCAALVAGLAVQTVVGLTFFKNQRAFYQVLSPASLEAIAWLDRRTPKDSLVAVSPYKNDWRLGTWITALGHRRTLSAASPVWLYYADERASAAKANRIFGMSFPSPKGLQAARDLRVDYVFCEKTWPGYSRSQAAQMKAASPNIVAFENEAVIILTLAEAPDDASTGSLPQGVGR